LGGEIRAECLLGTGSTFYFNIEAEVAKGTSIKPEMWVQPVENLSEEYPLRILVAEDNPSNQRVLVEIAQKGGLQGRCSGRWKRGSPVPEKMLS
jgi:PleD family two-component response regulator